MKKLKLGQRTKLSATLNLIEQALLTFMALVGLFLLTDNTISRTIVTILFVSVFKEQYVIWRRVCNLTDTYLIKEIERQEEQK